MAHVGKSMDVETKTLFLGSRKPHWRHLKNGFVHGVIAIEKVLIVIYIRCAPHCGKTSLNADTLFLLYN